MDNARNAEFAAVDGLSNRTRSGSATSHKRDLSGTFLSRLSFLRMSQSTPKSSHSMDQDGDSEDVPSNMGQMTREASERGKAMAAVIQQQRRTRRRRGSLRKTALLGTRLESRDKKTISKNAEALRTDAPKFQGEDALSTPRSPHDTMAASSPPKNGFSTGGFEDDAEGTSQLSWFRASSALKIPRPTVARRRQGLAQQANNKTLLEDETATDDDDLVSFPRINTSNNSPTGPGTANASTKSTLHISTTSSNTDPYYSLEPDAAYRPIHRKSSPLATHPVEMKNNADITWDYSETEWWGWIILMVTWLVFVVGIGSCFEVWSWAWDVGETPYAPPELEDDPTLPIVGYYPALIILTAVMSWVWVVVAWVGMKYFKHANISGDDS